MGTKVRSIKMILPILLAVIVLIVLIYFSGFGAFHSNIRLGWNEHKNMNSWSASYSYMSGICRGKLMPADGSDVLHVNIETEKGTIGLQIKDTDGNILFSEEKIKASSFDVDITGNIEVRISANGHKGSFDFRFN